MYSERKPSPTTINSKDDELVESLQYEGVQQSNQRLRDLIHYKYTMLEYYRDEDRDLQTQYEQLAQQQQLMIAECTRFMQDIQQSLIKYDQQSAKALAQDQQQIEWDEVALTQQIESSEEVKSQLLLQVTVSQQLSEVQESIRTRQANRQLIAMQRFKLQQQAMVLSVRVAQRRETVMELQQDTKQLINQQRTLNNELQEAKGNIRVYCRVRPLIQGEDQTQVPCVQSNGDCSLSLTVPKNYHKSDNFLKSYSFNFEHIFEMQVEQNTIYAELSQLIENVIDGHNVCIFAYGQTGSGKTFTMQGLLLYAYDDRLETYEMRGVIPRAVEHIFSEIKNLRDSGWLFKIRCGFQEIYNETIRDLITNQKTDDICLTEVHDQTMVYDLFRRAMENRKVAETQCNEFSSRSHFIFQLNLSGTLANKESKVQVINGTLNLIDLAGSERLNLAKTEGDRLKETQCINKSLTALSDVINALAQKSQFVPYRNSKLTHMLQKYLEGSSKTLMLVNISPRLDDFNQTLQSLRFAEKVKSCKAGNQLLQKNKT